MCVALPTPHKIEFIYILHITSYILHLRYTMDTDNVRSYLHAFHFMYETKSNSTFCIIKKRPTETYNDYTLTFNITKKAIKVELTGNNETELKQLLIRIDDYIKNITHKEAFVNILQHGYRYSFLTSLVKYIESDSVQK